MGIGYNELTAKSAICVEVREDAPGSIVVLHEKDADKPIAPASIVKLLTAVTALRIAGDRGIPPSVELVVLPGDMAAGSGRNLSEGDRFSFRDGLANLLLASSNVTANVIARTFGAILSEKEGARHADPSERFVREINLVAAGLGMTISRFLNPHGLPVRGQRSTARELALLVKECLEYPLITEFWGLEKHTISIGGPNARQLIVESIFRTSARQAIPDFSVPRFRGGKSGTLWPSVFNLAAVSETSSGRLIISVAIGSPSLVDRHSDYLAMVEIGDIATHAGLKVPRPQAR